MQQQVKQCTNKLNKKYPKKSPLRFYWEVKRKYMYISNRRGKRKIYGKKANYKNMQRYVRYVKKAMV